MVYAVSILNLPVSNYRSYCLAPSIPPLVPALLPTLPCSLPPTLLPSSLLACPLPACLPPAFNLNVHRVCVFGTAHCIV